MTQQRKDIAQKATQLIKYKSRLTWFRKKQVQLINSDPNLRTSDTISFFPVNIFGIYCSLCIIFYNGFFTRSKNKLNRLTVGLVSIQAIYLILSVYGRNKVFSKVLNQQRYVSYYLRKQYQQQTGVNPQWIQINKKFEKMYIDPVKDIDVNCIKQYLN